MISAFQPSAFQNNAFQIGVGAAAASPDGVKRSNVTVRLAEVLDRKSTADFIKERLKLNGPPQQTDDVELKVAKPELKLRVRKGDEHARNIREQEKIARQARADAERADAERKEKVRIRNNAIIAIILASES